MESERCGTQEHVPEKGRVRLDYRQVNISGQILEISQSRSIEGKWVKNGAGEKVRGWLNGIDISRVSRKRYEKKHPECRKQKDRNSE